MFLQILIFLWTNLLIQPDLLISLFEYLHFWKFSGTFFSHFNLGCKYRSLIFLMISLKFHLLSSSLMHFCSLYSSPFVRLPIHYTLFFLFLLCCLFLFFCIIRYFAWHSSVLCTLLSFSLRLFIPTTSPFLTFSYSLSTLWYPSGILSPCAYSHLFLYWSINEAEDTRRRWWNDGL